MNVRYRVELSQTDGAHLTALLSRRQARRTQAQTSADFAGRRHGRQRRRHRNQRGRWRLDCLPDQAALRAGNLEAALSEAPRPGASRKLSSKEEALLVATACSKPPQGRARWTLELLAGELVSLTEHASVSRETVRRRLAENHLKPWRKETAGVFRRSTASMSRAWRMCSTSTPKSPIRNARWSVSMRARPSSSARFASRSQPSRARSNAPTANINATERSTCSSSSTRIGPGVRLRSPNGEPQKTTPNVCASLVDIHYPDAEYIRVVQDNLSTHSAGLAGRSHPPKARRILRRLEFHYTPKHASWLNMVEIEIGALRSQCLDRRIDTKEQIVSEIAAWKGSAQCLRRSHQMDVHNQQSSRQNGPRLPTARYPPRGPNQSYNHCAVVLVITRFGTEGRMHRRIWCVLLCLFLIGGCQPTRCSPGASADFAPASALK